MNKTLKRLLVLAACLTIVAAIVSITGSDVVAQIRAALIKDVDNPARQPFSASTNIVAFKSGDVVLSETIMTVPAGKRAVLEHCSCINYLEAGNNFIRFELRYVSGGVNARHQFVHTRVGVSFSPTIDIWSFSQPVRAYADAGTAITIEALRRSVTGSGAIECYISGHFVDPTLP